MNVNPHDAVRFVNLCKRFGLTEEQLVWAEAKFRAYVDEATAAWEAAGEPDPKTWQYPVFDLYGLMEEAKKR